jgi:hypothetical protein
MEVNNNAAAVASSNVNNEVEVRRTTSTTSLRWAALFLGELRDGLTMVSYTSLYIYTALLVLLYTYIHTAFTSDGMCRYKCAQHNIILHFIFFYSTFTL